MTEAQQPLIEQVYQFLRHYRQQQDGSPSYREIASGCFVAYGTVVRLLDQLEAQGRIQRTEGQKRSIRLVDEGDWKKGSNDRSFDHPKTEH